MGEVEPWLSRASVSWARVMRMSLCGEERERKR